MRALALLLTLLLGVLAHPAAAASRVASELGSTADRGRLGVDDVRRESVIRCSVVTLSDDRAEESEDPEPSLAPAHVSIPAQRCATSVAPADDGPSRIAWRLSTVGARGPPA